MVHEELLVELSPWKCLCLGPISIQQRRAKRETQLADTGSDLKASEQCRRLPDAFVSRSTWAKTAASLADFARRVTRLIVFWVRPVTNSPLPLKPSRL